jgi:hypothetical protein
LNASLSSLELGDALFLEGGVLTAL